MEEEGGGEEMEEEEGEKNEWLNHWRWWMTLVVVTDK